MPNVPPYQLATGKNGNTLAPGKPFVNNFLPNGGDMLRLNMGVPPTQRNHPDFSPLGLVQAAVLGLTDGRFNNSTAPQFIPNMDGFPNGRRLEDDVTRIELQAVSGVVLAAIGLWYDDFTAGDSSAITQDLLDVLTYSTGVEENDAPFTRRFPYLASPRSGDGSCSGVPVSDTEVPMLSRNSSALGVGVPSAVNAVNVSAYPNPFIREANIQMNLDRATEVQVQIYNSQGQLIDELAGQQPAGKSEMRWFPNQITPGWYFAKVNIAGVTEVIKILNQQ